MQFPPLLSKAIAITPLAAISLPVKKVFDKVIKDHPQLFNRLGAYRSKRYAFSPSDMPLIFLIEPEKPSIEVHRKDDTVSADAQIEGPIFLLLALLEGRLDADALFFSRDVSVTGDMEAMLALRNALDDSNIDLPHDLSRLAGPFSSFAEKLAVYMRSRVLPEEPKTWN